MIELRARSRAAFTLIELLVAISIIAMLAAILFPVFAQVREKARQAVCLSNMKQIGIAWRMYMDDNDGRMPDRCDLKSSLPGGYRPWTTWPPSDPRCGWAAVVLQPYVKNLDIWTCPSLANGPFSTTPQVYQDLGVNPPRRAYYWMWAFDHNTTPVPLDNLWGKTDDQAVSDLDAANNILQGVPTGPSDVELLVDPYFPRTAPGVPVALSGRAVHQGGRNRLILDCHAKFLRDIRTSS